MEFMLIKNNVQVLLLRIFTTLFVLFILNMYFMMFVGFIYKYGNNDLIFILWIVIQATMQYYDFKIREIIIKDNIFA